jgi:hypothetical protein
MRRLLSDIADERGLGDVTTLRDPARDGELQTQVADANTGGLIHARWFVVVARNGALCAGGESAEAALGRLHTVCASFEWADRRLHMRMRSGALQTVDPSGASSGPSLGRGEWHGCEPQERGEPLVCLQGDHLRSRGCR